MDAHKPFRCDICGKSFQRKAHVTTHRRIHTGEKPFACDICNKTLSDGSCFARHKIIHTGVREKPYECDICEKNFTQGSNLVQHKMTIHRMIHTGKKPFIFSKPVSLKNQEISSS